MRRRTFLKSAAAAAAGALWARRGWGETTPEKTATIVVVHGTNLAAMLAAGMAKLGGWASFVKAGGKVTLKPNAAWASTPDQGGNTHPDLVAACIDACRQAGAKDVVLPENPCSPARTSFPMSGIAEAAEKSGGRLYCPAAGDFREITLPQAKVLKQASVPADVLTTDCLINMPVAKTHGGAMFTVSMKNWMGSVADRGFWHRAGLHQCIADFSTWVKPSLIVVDASRIMTANGPRGPGPIEKTNQIILGRDPVAVDAYAVTLFKAQPFDVPYIRLAHEMGVGCGDLGRVTIETVNV